MTKTPEELRKQAQEYRDLHTSMAGSVLSEAIEQVAEALERSADTLEAEQSHSS
jgi:hypothetical protein